MAGSRKRSEAPVRGFGILIPRLNAIVDADLAARAGWSVPALASAFLEGGARFLQLRAKSMSGSDFLEAAVSVVGLAQAHGALVVINDRADIARLSGAGGVHVGQHDLPPEAARRVYGPGGVVGRSTHTLAELDAAAREPVDYIAIGPVFGTFTKATGHDAVGLAMVRQAASYGRPVVAIGGITLETAASVIAAGAQSVAVISDLLAGGDPAARARAYVDRLTSV